ncbi:mitochondrial proton/calcium exchanger protein-like protein isoform X1 [Tanacetum coccineum]
MVIRRHVEELNGIEDKKKEFNGKENKAVMSSASFPVTYTSVYTDSKPWRFYWGSDEEPSDVGSPRVILYGYDGLPMHPVAPPSLNYVFGPEHPQSPDYVPGPEHPPSLVYVPYVPKPEYPEYLVPSGDEAPMEDQPLPDDASPTALSSGYVANSDPKEDPEEDPEEDHADYPAGGGDDDESSDDNDDDDADDEDDKAFEDEDDDEEEEEHLALADSSIVPVVDPVPLAGDTEAFKTDESTPTPPSPILPQITEIARLLALPTLPPSSLTLLSSLLPQIPSPPLPVSSPPLPLPSPTKRACFTTPASEFEVGESSATGVARQPGLDIPVMDATAGRLMSREDREATYAHRAWTGSEDMSAAIEAHVTTLEAHVATLIAQTSSLQIYLTTSLGPYSYEASHNSIPRKEEDLGSFTLPCFINNVCFNNALADLGASVSVMPLSTYLNLGLGELAHTKLTVELADRTMKYPKGIAENVLVGIGKFVFPVDFIILDMPEDIKVPLILGRPFLSTAHAKIDVFKRKITLRVGEEKIIFKSVKPASSLIKRVYMLSLRERMELDLEARLMGETLVLNRSLDPFFEDYIELNDLNVPLELRRDQVDDLMPTIEEGEVVEEFRARNDARMVSKFFGYPSDCDYDKKIRIDCAYNLKFSCMIDFAVLEDMDAYRDEGMGDVIFGEPFLREVRINGKQFEGMISIHNGTDISNITRKLLKTGKTRTRESEEYKRSQRFKAKAKESQNLVNLGQ